MTPERIAELRKHPYVELQEALDALEASQKREAEQVAEIAALRAQVERMRRALRRVIRFQVEFCAELESAIGKDFANPSPEQTEQAGKP